MILPDRSASPDRLEAILEIMGDPMAPDPEPEYVVATYEEIRLRFGMNGTDQARMKAKRRKWEVEPKNNPGAVTRIRVPRQDWDAVPDEREGSRGSIPGEPDQSQAIRRLEDAVTVFREERDRLVAERNGALAQLQAERNRAADEAAKLREEREEARIRAARAEATIEEARRPFWRRWIG